MEVASLAFILLLPTPFKKCWRCPWLLYDYLIKSLSHAHTGLCVHLHSHPPTFNPPTSVTPPEILKRGPEAVRAFHKALREGKQKLPQCKLLVLGEARVGKTSLLRNMTGLKFEPNLVRTHGIENQCIETMIDSRNIINWKTINESEQAHRDQENQVKAAIAEALNDPDIIDVKTTKKISNVLAAEQQITEKELLAKIHEHLHQAEQQRIEQQRIKQQKIHHHQIQPQTRIQHQRNNAARTPEQIHEKDIVHIPDSITQTSPQMILETLTISPPEQVKQGIADQSITQPPTVVKEKKSYKHAHSQKSEQKPKVISKQPQTQPVTYVAQRSRLGRRYLRTVLNQIPSEVCKTDEPALRFEVLDFAGQKEYRPMHHCFMSRHAIYIVVCNLQHLFDQNKSDTFGHLKYWLNSIHTHVHNAGYKHEKYIFLVGTHRNGMRNITDEDLKALSSELQEDLFRGNCRFKDEIHFYSHNDLIITGVENSLDQSESGIEIIKKEIELFSKSLPFLAETYPSSWIDFRVDLLKIKLDISPILELSEAKQIAKVCKVDETAVHTALQLFHDNGVIIYPGKLFNLMVQ